jgi:hypothetical protein
MKRVARSQLNRWQQAALAALHRYSDRHQTILIRRSQLIAEELPSIAAAVDSRGATPGQTLSRVLQELRRFGMLHHVERGVDLLLDSPISADAEDYPDRALDIAIRRGELRIEDVPTGDSQVLARRRRGQSRLRILTLSNYFSRCGLCDVRNTELLIASHIVRWGDDPAVRGRLTNVLCLCRMHDALFEHGYISVCDDLTVLKRTGVTSTVIAYLQGTSSRLRRPRHHLPAAIYLHRHRVRNGFEREKRS